VRNPNGATDSNALCSTTPGMPSVTSVCRIEGTACGDLGESDEGASSRCDHRNELREAGRERQRLRGDGDLGHPAGLAARAATSARATGDSAVRPRAGTVEVKSPTEIVVQLDTLSAIALPGGTTYYIAVWNPGGNPAPQMSNGCAVPTATFMIFP
jgi:hypothetical protein